MNFIKKLLKSEATFIGTITFIIYGLLASKEYTWLFASGDSGDWLAASNMWIVPQPYGSPLYIVLGHLVDLLPGSLVTNMTLLLSVLPSAITVAVVFIITKKLSGKKVLAYLASIILLGSGVFLSQSTVLEEYAIAVMFVTLGFYFFISDKPKLTALMLGLGSAVHIVAVALAGLWFLIARKEWCKWVKVLPIYIITGILPYGLILYLMSTGNTPLLAGNGLSLEAINAYLGSTSVFGTLSIFDFPVRFAQFLSIIIMSFGLALVTCFLYFKKRPWELHQKIMFISIFFPVWYYLTCLDPSTWTFMAYASPFIAITGVLGISKLKLKVFNLGTVKVMVLTALAILVVSTSTLNANVLSAKEPNASNYYNEVQQLPEGCVVVCNRGGFEGMAVFYAISEGKGIIPVFLTNYGYEDNVLYSNYLNWIHNKYGLEGSNTQELIASAMDSGLLVFCITHILSKWNPAITTEATSLKNFALVTGVDTDYVVHTEENRYNAK